MPAADLSAARPDARTLTERAYRAIRADLLAGLLPPESKLRIDALTKRYGIGATPVREALSRLTSEGFVTTEEQKGFRVGRMSAREFREITDLRIMLETEATRISIRVGDETWEAGIVAAHYRLDRAEERFDDGQDGIREWEDRNRDFHDALVAACDSVWLMRLRSILFDQSHRYRRRSLLTASGRRDVRGEHQAMRDAVLARDADAACALTRQHLETTFAVFSAALPSEEGG